MALAELIGKLRSKKQATERTAFQHYLEAVKDLAGGSEIDADEVGHILDSAGKSETDLERDVNLQQQRLAWAAQMQANRQAVQDRVQAERELSDAQRKLQDAFTKLQPAVDVAHDRLNDANHRFLTTTQAESWLAEHILDSELLEREQAVSVKLGAVSDELKPLMFDRVAKLHSLGNAEGNLSRLQARKEGDWIPAGLVQYFNQPADVRELAERVDDLKSQISQLDEAIRPRQQRQRELQAELSEIHRLKLEP